MRGLSIVFLFVAHHTWAQVKLDGVKVVIEETETSIQVNATYLITVPDEIEVLNLKALKFKGSSIQQLTVNAEHPDVDHGSEVSALRISFSEQKSDSLKLQYQVTPGFKGEIPLFFGDWQSTSSDQDFFQLQMIALRETSLLFPNDHHTKVESTYKAITSSLPATVSMIRIDDSGGGSQWANRVDQMVIVIFLIIGALIWFNRKRLIYG